MRKYISPLIICILSALLVYFAFFKNSKDKPKVIEKAKEVIEKQIEKEPDITNIDDKTTVEIVPQCPEPQVKIKYVDKVKQIEVPKIVYQEKIVKKLHIPQEMGCHVDWANERVLAVGNKNTYVSCTVNWRTKQKYIRMVPLDGLAAPKLKGHELLQR